ncbi:MAG: hypothetical protein GJT30_05600 [Geobacter sp.]|nr:hypothetical protein [Geobacter sp.]
MKRILKYDWDAIAGIIAAVAAIIMHMLHVVEAEVLLMISVVLIALLFLRDLRRERQSEHIEASLHQTEVTVKDILSQLSPPDAVLVGPLSIRQTMEDFSRRARNEMLWFHVCPVMFKRQELFDALLKTAIENPAVKSIQFILDTSDREMWESEVVPKIKRCASKSKVRNTIWTSISGGVSAIISDLDKEGKTECLLSFWGEPFMARTASHNVPRYVFQVQSHSELVGRMVEVVRTACLHKC